MKAMEDNESLTVHKIGSKEQAKQVQNVTLGIEIKAHVAVLCSRRIPLLLFCSPKKSES